MSDRTPGVKQTIVVLTHYVNSDGTKSKVKAGKLASQACHASIAWLTNRLYAPVQTSRAGGPMLFQAALTHEERLWIKDNFTKILLGVNSEEELVELYNRCKEAGLTVELIQDDGTTVYGRDCYSALAIGPHYTKTITPFTSHLKLIGN